MRILVTGGYGFIGSNFIHHVLNKDVELIVNIDKATYAANTSNVPISSKLINIQADINDKLVVAATLEKHQITHIVHFAAESHVDNSIAAPTTFVDTNVVGTLTLLEAARRCKTIQRFHHVSTDEVYGSLGVDGFFTETTPYDPRSPYSASKASSDHLVRAYHHTYDLPITISNCSNNYGPRQHVEKLIPKAITNILTGKKIPIYGQGVNVRDWLYVDDHCDAIWTIITSDVQGETYNVGGDCEMKNIDIIRWICDQMNVTFENVIEYIGDRPGHDFRYAIDHSKITQQLGWTPSHTLDQGIKQTINFYEKQ